MCINTNILRQYSVSFQILPSNKARLEVKTMISVQIQPTYHKIDNLLEKKSVCWNQTKNSITASLYKVSFKVNYYDMGNV